MWTSLCPALSSHLTIAEEDGNAQALADLDSKDCTPAWLLLEEALEDAGYWWQGLVFETLLHTHRHTVSNTAATSPQRTTAAALDAQRLECENAQAAAVECHMLGMGAATRPGGFGGKQHGLLCVDENLRGSASSCAGGKDSFGHRGSGTPSRTKQAAAIGSSRCCYCLCDAAVVALFVLGPRNEFSCTVHSLLGQSVEKFEIGDAGDDDTEQDAGGSQASSGRAACSETEAQLTRLQNAAKVSMQLEVWKAGRDA